MSNKKNFNSKKKIKFFPTNPKKYVGDVNNIILRSNWEKQFAILLDKDPRVIKWASEEYPIMYRNPHDNKIHKYYPDFIVSVKSRDGSEKKYIIEIKPYRQTKPPKINRKKTKGLLQEQKTYEVNEAKWKACEKFCRENNLEFLKITEKNIKFNR